MALRPGIRQNTTFNHHSPEQIVGVQHYLLLIGGYFVTLLLIRWVILARKRQPISTVAWVLAIVLLPYVGGLLFLFFGINRVERRKARKLQATQDLAGPLAELTELAKHHLPAEYPLSDLESRLARLAERAAGTPATQGNHIEVLTDTNITFRRIEQAIEQATSSVHLEYYIWRTDRTGTRLRDLLIRKAQAGVAVRCLYDQFGSLGINKRFLQPMRDAGIRVAPFLPGTTLRERWSINLRSHRKIVVVDGRIGFTGGMNIGDEYLGKDPRFGFWRDTHLQMTGPVTLQLQRVFAEDWYYAVQEDLTETTWFPEIGQLAPLAEALPPVAAQVVSSGPVGEVRTLHSLIFAAINEARSHVYLTTSYFVPTESLQIALETAALRGVKVRLLVPRHTAIRATVLAGRSFYEALLLAGVEIHEYRRGMLHSKTITVDGCWSLIGSPNLDARSLLLNFETAVACYDQRIASELEQQFESDLVHARWMRYDLWIRRPLRQVFLENVCRMFSPIL